MRTILPMPQEGIKTAISNDFVTHWVPAPHDTPNTAHKRVSFHVPGAVVGKGRPRIGKAGGFSRMFTPEKTANYEATVKQFAHANMLGHGYQPFLGPLHVNMLIGVQIPASWSKKKQAQALAGTIYPTSKPDLDNSIKSVFDAMNGVVYRDDAQVVTTVTKKRYREAPGLWVSVFQITG